jgi:hypothetical protein
VSALLLRTRVAGGSTNGSALLQPLSGLLDNALAVFGRRNELNPGKFRYGPEEEQIRSEIEAAERKFRSHPGVQELAAEWLDYVDLPAQVLGREARSADLVVIGRDLERLRAGMYRTPDPGDVIMAAGRPVLVVPPGAAKLDASHVVVAWKDIPVRRAVPFGTHRRFCELRKPSTSLRSRPPPSFRMPRLVFQMWCGISNATK